MNALRSHAPRAATSSPAAVARPPRKESDQNHVIPFHLDDGTDDNEDIRRRRYSSSSSSGSSCASDSDVRAGGGRGGRAPQHKHSSSRQAQSEWEKASNSERGSHDSDSSDDDDSDRELARRGRPTPPVNKTSPRDDAPESPRHATRKKTQQSEAEDEESDSADDDHDDDRDGKQSTASVSTTTTTTSTATAPLAASKPSTPRSGSVAVSDLANLLLRQCLCFFVFVFLFFLLEMLDRASHGLDGAVHFVHVRGVGLAIHGTKARVATERLQINVFAIGALFAFLIPVGDAAFGVDAGGI